MFSLRLIPAARGLPPVVVFSLAALLTAPAAGQCRYTAITFRGPDHPVFGPPATIATGLNNHDQVVGYYFLLDGPETGYVWSEETGVVPLPAVPGGVRPRAINDAGLIVGSMGSSPGRGFLWDGTQYIELGIPAGGTYSSPAAINEHGQIVGTWGNGVTGPHHGFLWQDGLMTNLGDVLNVAGSRASGITEQGAIAGSMGTISNVDFRAMILEIGTPPFELPPVIGGYTSQAGGINESLDVWGTGSALDPTTQLISGRGFVWVDGVMSLAPTLPGYRHNHVDGFDRRLGAVGHSTLPGSQPWVWQGGALADLEVLIDSSQSVVQLTPAAMNSMGKIAASSNQGGALLTPTYLPGDLNRDCVVSLADLVIVLLDYGCNETCGGDVDENGVVDLRDIAIVLGNWSV